MRRICLIAAATVSLAHGAATAGRTTVNLQSQDVVSRSSEQRGTGNYFVMDVAVPEDMRAGTLLGAILEFYVDVESRADTVIAEEDTLVQWTPTPVVEVYALSSSSGSALDSARWNEEYAFPVPIGVGENKVVRVDITRLVKYLLENPEENHGIVVGSLTGRKEGILSLRESFGSGVKARIRYMY